MGNNNSMQHLNGNLLCAVDVETTGLDPTVHDIIEIGILPLDKHFDIYKDYSPFTMLMKPRRPESWEGGGSDVNGLTKKEVYTHGFDPYKAADMLEEWFERMQLGYDKKIVPLAHNWPFDRGFLLDWLGKLSFEYIFHGHYRDSMMAALFHNDRMCHQIEPYDFAKVGLQALCNRLSIENKMSHRALYDCMATAECYKKLTIGTKY